MLFRNYKMQNNIIYILERMQMCLVLFYDANFNIVDHNLFCDALEITLETMGSPNRFKQNPNDFLALFQISYIKDIIGFINDAKQQFTITCENFTNFMYDEPSLTAVHYTLLLEKISHKIEIYMNESSICSKPFFFKNIELYNSIRIFKYIIYVSKYVNILMIKATDDIDKFYHKNFLNDIGNKMLKNNIVLENIESIFHFAFLYKTIFNYDGVIKLKDKFHGEITKLYPKCIEELENEIYCFDDPFLENFILKIHSQQNVAYSRLHKKIFPDLSKDLFFSVMAEEITNEIKYEIILENHAIIFIMAMYRCIFENKSKLRLNFVNMLIIVFRYNIKQKFITRFNTLRLISNLLTVILKNITDKKIESIKRGDATVNTLTKMKKMFSLNRNCYELNWDLYDISMLAIEKTVSKENDKEVTQLKINDYNAILQNIYDLTTMLNMNTAPDTIVSTPKQIKKTYSYKLKNESLF